MGISEWDISREEEEGGQDEVYLLELPKTKSGVSRRSKKRKIGDVNGISDRKTINKAGNRKRSGRVPRVLQQTSGLVPPSRTSPMQIQTPTINEASLSTANLQQPSQGTSGRCFLGLELKGNEKLLEPVSVSSSEEEDHADKTGRWGCYM